eukprot:5419461-Pyramimonas_sp.AAC.1
MKDMRADRGDAQDAGDAEAAAAAKAAAQADARAFLGRNKDEGKHALRPRKYRTTSHELLVHTNHSINLVMQNGGLKAHFWEPD